MLKKRKQQRDHGLSATGLAALQSDAEGSLTRREVAKEAGDEKSDNPRVGEGKPKTGASQRTKRRRGRDQLRLRPEPFWGGSKLRRETRRTQLSLLREKRGNHSLERGQRREERKREEMLIADAMRKGKFGS